MMNIIKIKNMETILFLINDLPVSIQKTKGLAEHHLLNKSFNFQHFSFSSDVYVVMSLNHLDQNN